MHMMSCMRSWTLSKDSIHCTDSRDRDTKRDVQQVRMMKNKDGKVMTDEENVLRMWKDYCTGLMNEENEIVNGPTVCQRSYDQRTAGRLRKSASR